MTWCGYITSYGMAHASLSKGGSEEFNSGTLDLHVTDD